jgi:hypothetical protein
MASMAIQSRHKGLRSWVLLQCRKKSSTLRVSPKGSKPSPKIVYKEGRQDEGIASYLEYSELIKDIINEISSYYGARVCGGCACVNNIYTVF